MKMRGGEGRGCTYIHTYCKWFDLLCILQRNILSLSVYVCTCTSNATNVLGQLSEFSSRQLLTQRVALPPSPSHNSQCCLFPSQEAVD